MKSYFALIAVGLDAAATRFKSKIEKPAAAVAAAFVGIGLLVGSLSLLADPIQTGPFPGQITNVCAPVILQLALLRPAFPLDDILELRRYQSVAC